MPFEPVDFVATPPAVMSIRIASVLADMNLDAEISHTVTSIRLRYEQLDVEGAVCSVLPEFSSTKATTLRFYARRPTSPQCVLAIYNLRYRRITKMLLYKADPRDKPPGQRCAKLRVLPTEDDPV